MIAVSFADSLQTLVLLAVLFDKAASHQVLQLFVGPEAKHFFSSTHRVPLLQPVIDQFEEVVKSKELIVRSQYVYQFVSDVIRKST